MGAIAKYLRPIPPGAKYEPPPMYPKNLRYTDSKGNQKPAPNVLYTLAEVTLRDLETIIGKPIDRTPAGEPFRIIWGAILQITRLDGEEDGE